jgi:hypothetical protein
MVPSPPATQAASGVRHYTGGSDRPRAALGSGLRRGGFAGRSTGLVSTSNRSFGVHSSAVHNAASVCNFTWLGVLVNSADTDALDSRGFWSRRHAAAHAG